MTRVTLPTYIQALQTISMRIQRDSHQPTYPLAPSVRAAAPRADAEKAAQQTGRVPLAAYVAPRNPVDVERGVSPRAQRAIAAYTQNHVFEQRSQYAQLLGVDVYA